MTIHTPITIRTAPETCIARTQRPSAERLFAGIFYIDVALDVGPTSSVLAHAAPSQSDPRCHRQRSLTPTVSRPRSRRMSRVRIPSLPPPDTLREAPGTCVLERCFARTAVRRNNDAYATALPGGTRRGHGQPRLSGSSVGTALGSH